MSRNRNRVGGTKDRSTGASTPPETYPEQKNEKGFSFVVPTNFVELPSMGKYYPDTHPLHLKETIEIRHMTAKEEDILTSKALLRKGVALDRVIQNLLVDRAINADTLLVGDRNAIVISARISAYGSDYQTNVTCPACGDVREYDFNLIEANQETDDDTDALSEFDLTDNNNGTFDIELPVTKVNVTFKLLTGEDEKRMNKNINSKGHNPANKGLERGVTAQLFSMVVAINGDTSTQAKKYFIENIPSMDSRHLRFAHRAVTPNVDLSEQYECLECGFETEMEVPLTADFFWPKR